MNELNKEFDAEIEYYKVFRTLSTVKRRLKIAQVLLGYHPVVGGIGRHVAMFAQGLRRRGHVVDIITTDWAPANYEQEDGVIRLKSGLFGRSKGLSEHLNGYDIIHVHGYQTFQPYQAVKAASGKIPIVFTPHYHPFGKKPRFLRRSFDMTFGKSSISNADKIILVSPMEKGYLSKFTIPEHKITIIPNPVDDVFLGYRKTKKLSEKRNILFVGRLDQNKGLDILIKAYAVVSGDINGVSLTIAGKDMVKITPVLQELVRKLNLNNIQFTGEISQKDLLKLYSKSDVFVMPSSYEAFGITIVEAMAQGIPVIATDVGGIPFVLDYGRAGIIVPYGNENILAEKIKLLLTNKKLRKSFQQRAFNHVQNFRIDKLTKELEKVYEELVQESHFVTNSTKPK